MLWTSQVLLPVYCLGTQDKTLTNTLQKWEVCAWCNCLLKCFKISHIFGLQTFRCNFGFLTVYTLDLCRQRLGNPHKNAKQTKNTISSQKYNIFWSISLDNFIKHKLLISKEWPQNLSFPPFACSPSSQFYQYLLDNAPNYLVGCVIQKR